MDRAYSLFEIKSIDEDARVIEGVATTPTTDRTEDIVDSMGAVFKLPIPFCMHHDKALSSGHVTRAKVEADGIHVRVEFVKVTEPPTLKERLDVAWAEVKHKLVRGFSIGFRPIEVAEIKGTWGRHFLRWEWLELSGVVIAANAEANITTIKSIATQDRAASGTGHSSVKPHSPGVSGHVVKVAQRGAQSMAKTITEQISAFEATRQAKSARMDEIMTKAGESGETLDTANSEEYDGLDIDVKKIDVHLKRLADHEIVNKAAAKPVIGDTTKNASDSRGGNVITIKQNLPPGIEFARYAICVMMAKGNLWQAQEIAKARYPDQPRILNVIKAAVAAGTTTDATWAGSLVDYTNLSSEFIEFLRPSTIIGKFGQGNVPSLTSVPFNVRILGQTSGGDGYWVGQGKPKPLTKFDFAPTTLTWAKVAAISVLAEELVRFSNPSAEALVRNALRDALVARLDTDFVDPDKGIVANVSPASITNNVSPIQTAGSSEADVRVDIMNLMAPFIAANISPAGGVFIMSQTRALALSLMLNALGQPSFPGLTMLGGTFMGFPVITSQYVVSGSPASDLVIFVNAPDIYLSDDGQVVIDASREASLEMSDAPTQNGAAGTGSSMVSLWQNNLLGLRAERFINWAKRRTQAVAFIENVVWGAGGGSPS